jgi:ascorbate PTS system EIIB component
MLKVIAACGSGMGSSMMIKLKLQKVLKELGIAADVKNTNAGEAKSTASQYHVIVCSESLKDTFKSAEEKGITVVTLKNLLDEKELKQKLLQADVAALENKIPV